MSQTAWDDEKKKKKGNNKSWIIRENKIINKRYEENYVDNRREGRSPT